MSVLRDPAEVFAAEIGWQPALERTDLLAEPVAAVLQALEASSPEGADLARQAQVVPIDPQYSDAVALNAHYALAPEATDIGDEYLRALSPKVWEKVEKERAKAQEETIKEVQEKKAAREKAKGTAAPAEEAKDTKDHNAA